MRLASLLLILSIKNSPKQFLTSTIRPIPNLYNHNNSRSGYSYSYNLSPFIPEDTITQGHHLAAEFP